MSGALAMSATAQRGGRRLLGLMLGLFVLPFAIVGGLFAIDWHPQSPGNYGELVTGLPALPPGSLAGADDQTLPTETAAARWTLLVATPGPCDAGCRSTLDLTRRLHVALYKGMPRVRRLWLSPAPAGDASLGELRGRWPDLLIARPTDPAWRTLLLDLPAGESRVFVLDPAGNPVLRYPANFDARRALRDVDRLLRFSWLG